MMLKPEEVDDGYFTPVASTTLASIFKDDSSIDLAVNPSLKYKPPQVKKTEENSKPDDASASLCVFSCSVIAYEWVHGDHMCKGKVGFAILRTVKSALSKIVLYNSDKSILSCTTITPLLRVTLKGAMISLYDDLKKNWGLCFNNKTIEHVKELLKKEIIIIKHHVSPALTKPGNNENADSDEATDGTDHSLADEGAAILRNNKASILNRIANVGHAILPTIPGSSDKTILPLDVTNTLDIFVSSDNLNVLPDESVNGSHDSTIKQDQEPTKSIAIQTCKTNVEANNISTNSIIESVQPSVTSLPLVNNQIFTYVNGYMVPLRMQVPDMEKANSADTCAEIEQIIHKLTQLRGVIRTTEIKHVQSKEKICKCNVQDSVTNFTGNNEEVQTNLNLKHISELEQSIREKAVFIKDQHQEINNLNEEIEKIKQDLNLKNEEKKQMVPKKEVDKLLASAVKNLMNNTFRSLASNFDNNISYTGDSVKGILAAVIKKHTVESLSTLLNNRDVTISIQPTNN